MRTRLLTATLFGAMALGGFQTAALADGGEEEEASPWSISLAFTSDYRFRGQSQTSRDPAPQASVNFESASGFFAGVWASTIDFSESLDFDSELEIDLYAGYNFSLGENTEGSLKATYYFYPDNPGNYEYFEFQAALSHSFDRITLSGELNYSPDYFNETGSAIAVAGGAEVSLVDNLSASGHVGYQWIDDNALFATPDFLYWDLGLTLTLLEEHITLDARYVATDLDDADCFGGTDLCEGGFVGTVTLAIP
ncbi:MAG: TorF family putative porin [Alphaproteobacteria bacterium]|nr:TorF family putative porin [Alphaproteobacteria bacterium]